MNKEKLHRLKAAGFRVGTAGDFLDLTDAERRLVALRLTLSRLIREARHARGFTQEQLAAQLMSSQSRIAKIESGAPGVSLDLTVLALFAVGGTLADLAGSADVSMPIEHQQPVPKKLSRKKRIGKAALRPALPVVVESR